METNQTAPEAGPAPEDVQGDSTSAGPQAGGAVGSASTGDGTGSAQATGPDVTGPGLYPWLRRLGVPRRAGWLGGVCAGVGARLGIDPVIVRGIVVVLAVLGAPFVLVYAIAWLLLPDTDGEIHLERLTRGVVDPAIVGIAVMGIVGFVPLVQGGWLGWRWWPDWQVSDSLSIFGIDLTLPLRIIWALLVVGAIVWFIVWLAQRASTNSPVGGAARMASAQAADPGSSAASAGATSAPPPADAPPLGAEPPVPAEGADAAEIAAWRHQHEQWRHSHAEWKAGQTEAIREAKAQAAEESRVQAREFQAQAAAVRAARKAARPRASAAFVFTALGLAVVAGAAAAIWAWNSPDTSGQIVPIALAAATLLLALAMVIAALRRRRSGALATFTALSLVAMLIGVTASAFAPFGTLIGPSSSVSLGYSQQLVQPFGDAYVSLGSYDGYPDETQTVTLTQGTGDTYLTVLQNSSIVLDATDAGDIDYFLLDRDGNVTQQQLGRQGILVLGEKPSSDPDGRPADARLVLRQNTGSVLIEVHE